MMSRLEYKRMTYRRSRIAVEERSDRTLRETCRQAVVRRAIEDHNDDLQLQRDLQEVYE